MPTACNTIGPPSTKSYKLNARKGDVQLYRRVRITKAPASEGRRSLAPPTSHGYRSGLWRSGGPL